MSVNSLTMASAISSSANTIDSEYLRIMRQLRAYGIEPTGDKSVDKAKLQKIEAAKDSQTSQFANTKNNNKNAENSSNIAITDNGQGTDQLAMLNKLKLGLL
ncbi:hypothetical protein DBY21_00855 [Candidatus Gastranaerophilales bacterium]|nr:MAG: hypothetical protein DBY21_00855 [Candidatus Gastranaerophilales bacterium]